MKYAQGENDMQVAQHTTTARTTTISARAGQGSLRRQTGSALLALVLFGSALLPGLTQAAAPTFTEGDPGYKGVSNAQGKISANAPAGAGGNLAGMVNQPPVISWTTPANAVVTAPAAFALTVNATDADGTVAKVDYYNGATLIGTATAAPYSYTWSNVSAGTYTLTAIATDNLGMSASAAALTVIANAAPSVSLASPAANAVVTAPGSFSLTANAADVDGSIAKVDYYNGTTLIGTATTAPYSYSWTSVPAGSYSLTAVATDNHGAATTSAAVAVIANAAPSISLASPAANAVVAAPGNFSLTANAADVDGSIAKVDYYNGTTLIGTATAAPYNLSWTNVPAGSYSLTARATDNHGAATTSAAVSVVSDTPPSVNLTGPAANTVSTAPASFTVTAAATSSMSSIARVEFYNGTTLLGTSTSAPYSFTWSNVPAGSYSLTAVATDGYGISNTSAAVAVVANAAPTVSLTSPLANAVATAPGSFTLTADAADSDGTIAKVDYYNGTTLIGSAITAPYSHTWSNVPAGNYSLTAVATDDNGAATTSAAVAVISNQAPTVTLTSPAAGARITSPNSFILTATATDADGTIAKVDFYDGTTLLGTATAAPYSYTWNNVPVGSYSLTAKATDAQGTATSSAATSVTAVANVPPAVSLTSPANGASVTAPGSFTLTATASSTTSAIASVDFFATDSATNTNTLVGRATAAPYSFTWGNVALGSYSITAVATDTLNATTTSAPVTVTVKMPSMSDHVMTAVNVTSTTNFNSLGGAIYFNDTMKNQGTRPSTASPKIGYYLSTDNVITTADTYLGERYSSSYLAAGFSSTFTGTRGWVPAGLAPGTYYVGAIADYTGVDPESDETNNALVATTITVTQPDMVMTAVSSTTTQVNTAGGWIYITDTQKNQGVVASTTVGYTQVGYYLSTDNVITTADTYLGNRYVDRLSAGASSTNTAGTQVKVPAGLPIGGTYYIGAIADHTGLQPETDETNNALVGTAITVSMPDLVVTAVSSTTTQLPISGGYLTTNYTFKNQGAVGSTVTGRVGFYLSTDNVITTEDMFIGSRSTYVLGAGKSLATGATFTVPAGLAAGTYYVGAIVDDTGLEPETDETNNSLAGTTFRIVLPDMVVTAVSPRLTKAPLNSQILIDYTLQNQGEIWTTVAAHTGCYLSTDNVITTADTLIGSNGQGGLNPGQSTVGYTCNSWIPAGLAPGFYYIGVITDYTGLQPESDEANNTLAGPMIAVGLPDLTMTTIGTDSTLAIVGQPFAVADTLKNVGTSTTTTGCRSVGYYLSVDSVITTDDALIGSRQQCGSLAAAGSSAATATSLTIPAGTPIGNYYLGAIADYAQEELESDEANNALATGAMIAVGYAPDAPTNAAATGGHTKATVSFTAPTNDGGSPVTGYAVTASPGGQSATGTASPIVVTGLTNGVNYTFTVRAGNAVGMGLPSAASNSVTPAPTVPEVPANAVATSGYTKAIVSFDAPAENGSPITGYTILANPGGKTAGGTASPITVTGLSNGVRYTFTVTATNGIGTSAPSQPSNSIIPALTAPDAPTNVWAVGGDRQAKIRFTAPAENGSAITGYTVTSNPGGVTATGTASPITIPGLTNGTSYTFTVTATNSVGTSQPSAPSNSIVAAIVPEVYYVHTDHLDTPRQITDTAGNVVWQWDNSDPFGSNMPNENPSGQGAFVNPLRFPGQYADKETNTYYNINRDYDPATGRYIQSDPIGLWGGINTYTYVLGNPLSFIDPMGLKEYADDFVGPLPPDGYHTSEMTQTRCGKVPPAPPGASTNINMWVAKNELNPYWFYSQVKGKSPWDYKQEGRKYEDFGNFNFGAVGTAFGLPLNILQRGAGWANLNADPTRTYLGSPLGGFPYGDDPSDQEQIIRGAEYCECMQH